MALASSLLLYKKIGFFGMSHSAVGFREQIAGVVQSYHVVIRPVLGVQAPWPVFFFKVYFIYKYIYYI